jgi:hypothetical protein
MIETLISRDAARRRINLTEGASPGKLCQKPTMKGQAVMVANDGTGAGLLAFLEWTASHGELRPNTAQSIAVATRRVLAVEADPDAVDVRNLDREGLFDRFETLNRTNYTTASMKVYRSRFYKGLTMYLAWLDKRPDWKTAARPDGAEVTARSASNGRPAGKGKARRVVHVEAISRQMRDGMAAVRSESGSGSQMVPYDLPLRPGLRVRLVLPEMLTRADAKRIAAFVDSLAFDQAEPPQEGA